MGQFSQVDTYVNVHARQQTVGERKVYDMITATQYFRDLIKDCTQEHFIALFFDVHLRPICWRELNVGDSSSCQTDIKAVIQTACLCGAEGVIVMHNHPSGDIRPSEVDTTLTYKLYEYLKFIGITLLDSVIVGDWQDENRMFSFRTHDKRPESPYSKKRQS